MLYDRIIIGAGLYGLYFASLCGKIGENVLVLEYDQQPFSRATYVNQARIHMGYHYPRSMATAVKSARYFERFVKEFKDCILDDFDQVYATSKNFSWTNSKQFEQFAERASIPCEKLYPEKYFKKGMCDGAFMTKEYTYDAMILRDKLLRELENYKNVKIICNARIEKIEKQDLFYELIYNGKEAKAPFILNATYASTNQILSMIGMKKFEIKYELCEIILCEVNEKLRSVGITVMDGPFFSIMPFGKTNLHSLTSVTFTPHETSVEETPVFSCQKNCGDFCTPEQLGNCNFCKHQPHTAWNYMSHLSRKYLLPEYGFDYVKSLYSIKPILKATEVDDSRPTVISVSEQTPTFVSVLSGKINTVYDLEELLNE